MCTLSFLPEPEGYVVAMNRDELKSRAKASAPTIHLLGSVSAVYPQEAGGGTWIAATSRGNLFALLNWNHITGGGVGQPLRSRGEVIPSLLGEATPHNVEAGLRAADLRGFLAFRLFGIFPGEKEIREWRWDGKQLEVRWHEWVRNHWFSSSRSDARAEAARRKACEMMWREGIQDAKGWLRGLHASHLPDAGAYSICVHRNDAATVSLTEVQYRGAELAMTYRAGNPCSPQGVPATITIPVDTFSRATR